jgi:hypothetical protein
LFSAPTHGVGEGAYFSVNTTCNYIIVLLILYIFSLFSYIRIFE